MSRKRRDVLLLLLATAVLFTVSLGGRDLWNPNEPIYGQAVREMERDGAWMIPTVNDKVFAEKPVLYYWAGRVCSFLPGGSSEANLRLPSVLSGLATVWMVWLLVLPYAGHRRALTAAGLLATTFGVFWAARTIQMDILVMVSTLGVLLPLTRVADHGMNRWKGWIIAGVAAGSVLGTSKPKLVLDAPERCLISPKTLKRLTEFMLVPNRL